MTSGISRDLWRLGGTGWYFKIDMEKCDCSPEPQASNGARRLRWSWKWNVKILLTIPSSSSALLLDISGVVGWGLRRSWGERSPTGRSASPRTSSRRSGWSVWWCRPRGSPALPRFRAQSRTAPYSSAAPGWLTTHQRKDEWEEEDELEGGS